MYVPKLNLFQRLNLKIVNTGEIFFFFCNLKKNSAAVSEHLENNGFTFPPL